MGSIKSKDKDLRNVSKILRKHLEVRQGRERQQVREILSFHRQPKLSFAGSQSRACNSELSHLRNKQPPNATRYLLRAVSRGLNAVIFPASSVWKPSVLLSQKKSPQLENSRCSERAVLGV